MVGLSLSLSLGPVRAAQLDPSARALISRMTPAPTSARALLINDAILALKAAGVWAKLEVLYFFAAADSQAALLNWISTSFNADAVLAPTFTADRGYASDGAASYLNTTWNASLSSLATLNSTSMGAYINAGPNTAADAAFSLGTRISATNDAVLLVPRGATTVRGRVNSGTQGAFSATATNRGLTGMSRTSSSLTTAYRNGLTFGTSAAASTAIPNLPVFICAANNDGTIFGPIQDRVAIAYGGAGLSDAENLALYNAALAYLTAIGGS